MDNFDWLEEEKKQQKLPVPGWLQEYWMHIAALVVIFGVLIFLIFNPASKSVTHENISTISANTDNNKQILIRMPDKTTKLATPETQAPLQAQPSRSLSPAAPSLKPAEPVDQRNATPSTANPSSRLPIKQIGIINSQASTSNQNQAKSSSTITAATSPTTQATHSSALIQPVTPATKLPAPPTLAPAPVTSAETINQATSNTTTSTLSAASTTTQTPAKATTQTATAQTAKPAATTPTPPPVTAAPQNVPAENADLGILLSRAPSHYILQLFGSHSESAAKSFISQNNLAGKALYAKVWQNNQDWFVVLYGDYADHNQATAAISQLPPSLQAQKPWPRSMQSVQEAIRQRLVRGK